MGTKTIAKARGTTGPHETQVPDHAKEEHWIGLEISAGKLYRLLVCGAVSVMDFRCLDHRSKCHVRALCLHACAHRLNERTAVGIGWSDAWSAHHESTES